jgi:ATP-dependent Clp protease ATP-binding subunit ClpC
MATYNFRDRVRQSLVMAREEALRLNHDYVGTEHLLLGVLATADGVAASVMRTLKLDRDRTRARVEESIQEGPAPVSLAELPYTSRAKAVLEFAMSEARDFNHTYVGNEHLFLALLREGKGVGGQVIRSFGITLESARAETLAVLELDGGDVDTSRES